MSPAPRQRRWGRTDATQQRILDAAIEVFRDRGYTVATIGDVVTASGASIGSIYHHFGGKSEMFVAIHERMTADIARRIADAAEAGRGGATASFDTQARAYLEAVWVNRRVAQVLAADDVPPGYDRLRRDGMRARFVQWLSALDIDSGTAESKAEPKDALLGRILIVVLAESAAAVMQCENADEAAPVIDAGIGYINRLIG